MTPTPKATRYEQLHEEATRIVNRHPWPPFINGYNIEYGEFEGAPAMWVRYRLEPANPLPAVERDTRADALNKLASEVTADLLTTFDDRWPYVRFEEASAAASSLP